MKLKSSKKKYNNYKVCHPQETIDRIKNGFEEVGLKVNCENWDYDGIFVSSAWIENDYQISGGKGTSEVLSQASAYAELAERFSSAYMGEYRINILKYQEYKYSKDTNYAYKNQAKKKIDLDYFYSPFAKKNEYDKVVIDLINNFPFYWQKAYSLTEKVDVNIPYFWYRASQGTNGLASGNSIEEATMHAIGEVLERHVTSKILTEKLVTPTIDPNTVSNYELIKIFEFFKKENINFIIKDFSLGYPLTTIAEMFTDNNCKSTNDFTDARNHNIVIGTDTNPEIAAIRCFTEYAQGFFKKNKNIEKFWYKWQNLGLEYKPDKDMEIYYHLHHIRIYDEDFLKKENKRISFREMPNFSNNDYLVELNNCITNFANIDVEILCIDLTHPVLNFPTVQVIIPQLQILKVNPSIINIFIKLAESNKLIDSNDKSIEILKKYNFYEKSLSNYLLTEKWYQSIEKIKEVIEKLEICIAQEPLENSNILELSVYEILSYLYIRLKDYKKAKVCSSILLELCNFSANQTKTSNMLLSYARIQYFLDTKSIKMESKSIGIIKIMEKTGLSPEIDFKWLNIGNIDSENPFTICNFKCDSCNDFDEICIWKKINISEFS